jgi:transposase
MYATGGLRRMHLRHHDNILKRLLVHNAGFNLGILMRKTFGVGGPRSLQGRLAAFLLLLVTLLVRVLAHLMALVGRLADAAGEFVWPSSPVGPGRVAWAVLSR